MKVVQLDSETRDAFLADLRLGILCTLSASGAPVAVPLWYAWNGLRIEIFSERERPTLRRLERDPRASLLVTNIPPEPARWVSLEGRAEIQSEGGQQTAERLTRRYLVYAPQSEKESYLRELRGLDLVRVVLEPEQIRSYAELG
jgi:PPOX class probable F420-dependent enzyme